MLLLPNKPPLTVSEVPQSRRSLAGRFWLRISREVAVRGQGVRGSGVSGPVGQGWEPERAGDLLPRRLSSLSAGGLSSSPRGPLHWAPPNVTANPLREGDYFSAP